MKDPETGVVKDLDATKDRKLITSIIIQKRLGEQKALAKAEKKQDPERSELELLSKYPLPETFVKSDKESIDISRFPGGAYENMKLVRKPKAE